MSDDSLIAKIAEEYTRELREGKPRDIEEYARRYPELAERIRELLPTLMLLEGMAGTGNTAPSEPACISALSPGALFGQYRVKREIGRGGMGIVYEAVHVLLEKRVALKVLLIRSLTDAGHLERFFREARMAASLHHTNIVPVFDVGQIAGTPYYAMQYIEGRGLDTVLRIMQSSLTKIPAEGASADSQSETASGIQITSGRPAPTGEQRDQTGCGFVEPSVRIRAGLPARIEEYFLWVARIGIQAAEGLAHAHERKVIHRDIKPSNLLIDEQGVLWIADFGLARRIEDTSVTQSGTLIGTPRYMSPEQAEAAKRPVDQRSDIYSLGATLYELLTCRPVFEGKTPHDVISQILSREPVAPRRLNAGIPADLSTIVMKAMAKRREDRYQSVSQLAEDLERWIRMEPIKARRIGIIGRTIRWCRRNPRLALVTSIAAAIILALSGVYYASLMRENANTLLALERETTAHRQAEIERGIADDERKRAEASRQEAEAAGEKESEARVIAESETLRAEKERNTAQAQKLEALYQNYRANLLVADLSYQEGELEMAGERLNMCDPSRRGLEWRYLRRSIDMSLASQTLNRPDLYSSHSIGRTVQEVAFEGDGKTVIIKAYVALEAHSPPAESNPVALSVFRYIPGGSGVLTPAESGTRVVTISSDGAYALSTNWNLPDRNILCSYSYGEATSPLACQPMGTLSDTTAKQDSGGIEKGSWNSLVITDTMSGRIVAILNHPNLGVWTGPLDAERVLGKKEFSGHEFAHFIQPYLIQGGNYPNVVDGVFSRDRSLLATWSWDNVIHIWDLRTQSLVTSLHGHQNFVVSACFSPDGTRIATGSIGGTVRLWSIAEGKEEETFHIYGARALALAYSPDGEHIAVGTQAGLIHVFHVRKEHAPLMLPGHSGFISSLAFSPDSSRLVTAGFEDQNIKVWDAVTGILLITLAGHTEGVADVAYSPDGSRIASGSRDGTVRIWNARDMLPELEGPGKPVIAIGLTSGGAGVVSISADRTLRVWDTTQPKAVRTLDFNKEQRPSGTPDLLVFPGYTAISQDKYRFAAPRLVPRTSGMLPDYIPYIIDIQSGNPVFSGDIVDGGTLTLTQVGLTPDASRLAALSRNNPRNNQGNPGGMLQLMDAASGMLLATWTISNEWMIKNGPIALSPDGTRVAVAVDAVTSSGPDHLNSTILVFKTGVPQAFLSIPGPQDTSAGQPIFFPDGKHLAFAAGNNVHIWDLPARRETAVLKGHHNSVGAIAVSPDGSRIVTGGSDYTVRIWDANRFEHLLTFRISQEEGIQPTGPQEGVQSLAVSSDNRCIAAGTAEGRIYLWNASLPGKQ